MSYWKSICLGCALFAAMGISASAQTFTTLADFPTYDIRHSALILGRDGNLYGVGETGGTTDNGRVFKITPSGTLTTVYSFCAVGNCTDGLVPNSPLALGLDGDFYGTTQAGGENSKGTVFKVSPSGVEQVLHSFNGTDGSIPAAGLVLGSDGYFYGSTYNGGTSTECTFGCGTIFKISPGGTLTTLYNFEFPDGNYPSAPLVEGDDGNFYGTTVYGGIATALCSFGCGTVFKITPGGEWTSVHAFAFSEGAYLNSALTQDRSGSFYGSAPYGGYDVFGACSEGCGTLFRITPEGELTVLQAPHSAAYSTTALVVASDRKIYGMSSGQLYSLAPSDQVTTVYTLPAGLTASDAVLQGTDGKFYGTYNYNNGASSAIYSLDTGLRRYVGFVIAIGKIGKAAQILGQGLTGTTSVTFNGVAAAKFSVVSDTYVTAVVPAGATTGAVVVATPAGNLSSNVSFRISK